MIFRRSIFGPQRGGVGRGRTRGGATARARHSPDCSGPPWRAPAFACVFQSSGYPGKVRDRVRISVYFKYVQVICTRDRRF